MENFPPGQGIVSEIWKMSGNFGELAHVGEFCYRPFSILPCGIYLFLLYLQRRGIKTYPRTYFGQF